MTEIRAALFVDFDNIFSGLRTLDPAAAEAFATDPLRWVDWLASGGDRDGEPRRFLLRLVYLNPNVYSRFRAFFTRSGFRVVDCPPLTALGKTSADTHIVIDVLDALAHDTRYDEFVIASADADFTPLLHRLRAHDRRTTVVTAGPASAAYRAMCDSVILPDEFAEAVVSPRTELTDLSPTGDEEPGPDDVALAVTAVRAAVAAASRPVVSATVAHAARAAVPSISTTWGGAGSFRAFVARHAPDLEWAGLPQPGYVFDPARHTAADVPQPNGADTQSGRVPVLDQVCRVTGTPYLSTEQWAVLFEELAAEIAENGFVPTVTSRTVRDRTSQRDAPVSRGAVNFVLQGLIYSGHGLPSEATPRSLAQAFAGNVRTLCGTAQMELTDDDLQLLDEWITSGLRD